VIAAAALLLLQVQTARLVVADTVADSTLPRVTLPEAIRRAAGVSPDYALATGQVDHAEWGRRAALLAFIVPSLTVSLDATKYSDDFFNIGIGAPTSTAVNFRASAAYELASVRKVADLGFTKAEREAAQANAQQTKLQLIFDTENDFLNVLISRELFRVARSRYARAADQFEISRARVLSGAAVQTDSLQLVVELTQARLDVLRRQLDLRVSRLQLGRRIGETGPVDAEAIDSTLPPPLSYTDEQLVQLALQQGPQYREARARERSASSFLTGTKSTYLPTINLSANYQRFDDSFFPSGRSISSGTIAISLPIWNLGQREIAVRQAKTNRDVARALRADLERAAQRDVVQAAEAYRIAREAVDLTQLQLEAARETYRVQELRYRSGANTILDLLEAQFQLTRAEAETVQSVYALYLSLAGLEAIVGQEFFVRSAK
jgi:outer membrane protein TolC